MSEGLRTADSGALKLPPPTGAVRQRSRTGLIVFTPVDSAQAPATMRSASPFSNFKSSRLLTWFRPTPAQMLSAEYAADYVSILIAMILLAVSDRAPPREVYVLKDQLSATAFPLLRDTVPPWAVPIIAILVPAAVFATHTVVFRRGSPVLHHLLLGLMASVMVTAAVTNCIKIPVGRLRPDFNARCWPKLAPVAWRSEDPMGGYPSCSGNPDKVAEGRKSFPSGHSSWSAAGLGYLTLFLWDVLTPMDGGGHAWRLVVSLLPAAGALAVGITRYMDYWHHWTDVLAGLTLGFVIAWLTFRQQQAKFVRLERQQSSQSQALLLGEDIEAQQVVPLQGDSAGCAVA